MASRLSHCDASSDTICIHGNTILTLLELKKTADFCSACGPSVSMSLPVLMR